ncbi:hypothetical protein [Actinomycetospora lemnae]|uniref:Secreted protein n=1 Tax=Actinomycetospora lemnae TaxID=3019891 RepID=A0ABT5T132_9PSEU|nr:hypothetical protein [Actinomycetospora sp. DW7H6]MDD7968719.1 hypothetical protein [Actinomycetospora sp. DW7H6]
MLARQGHRLVALLVLLAGALVLLVPAAGAHESTPTGITRLELDLGVRALALTITAPPGGAGRLPVVVLPRGDAPPGEVTLAAVRPGAAPGGRVAVPVAPVGQPQEALLAVDGPGAWEVLVADGATVARVPITVAAPAGTPGWVWAVRVGALVGVVALVAALSPGVRQRPRLAVGLGAVALVGVTVAVTAVATAPATPTTPTAATTAASAPTASAPLPATPPAGGHAGHAAHGAAAAPADAPAPVPTTAGSVVLTATTTSPATAGRPVDLQLGLTDSASGAVVDDLAVHDEALVHLAVIGPDRGLTHVHPVRTAPGRYVVRLTPGTAGRYGVFAEMERAGDGGHHVARTAIDVGGPAPAAAAPSAGPGARQVDGMQVDVAVADAVAGNPTRVVARFSENGRPVTDLQGWLGMAAHLMLLGPSVAGAPDPVDPASAFGHVHDMGVAGPAGTYGPEVAFDHTFPRAGRHQLWVQVQRDWRIVTVPVTVDVAPGSTPSP